MPYEDFRFTFAQEALDLGITGAYFILTGMENRPASDEFEPLKSRVVEEILAHLTPERIEEDPVLKGFRILHDRVQRSNKKNVASPENLLRMLLQTGRLPHINLLVDLYNLVSLQTRLALGAHDLKQIRGNVTLRLTRGDESFWPLGADQPKSVAPGEYAYIDDANDVLCRLEVRQVEKTKTTPETESCFFIVQGNPNTEPEYIEKATDGLLALLDRFCGGEVRMLHAPW